MKKYWSIAALAVLVAGTSASALSLDEGMDEVLSTNPVVIERLNNYRATLEDIRGAEAGYLPSLDWVSSVGWEKTKSPATAFQGKTYNIYEHSLQMTENLFNGFGTTKMVEYHKARLLAAANHFIEKANDTALNYTQAYINVLKARQLMTIAQENITFNEDIHTKVSKLFDAGLTTRSEVEKSDTSLSLARSNLIVAKNNLADAMFSLQRFMGRPVSADELQPIVFSPTLPTTAETMLAYTLAHNPSMMVSTYNVKAACILHEQRKSNFYPKVDAIVRQSYNNNVSGLEGNDDRFRAALTLSYNLYKGGADEAAVQQELSHIHQEQQTKHQKERELIEQGELSWSAYTYVGQQLEQLKKYKSTSEKTLELYKKEYDLGRRTLLDLLVAQNDYIAAKQQIVKAEHDLLFSKYRILDSMGSMVHTVLGTRTADHTALVGLVPEDGDVKKDENFGRIAFSNRQSIERRADTAGVMTRTLIAR